MKKSIYSKEYEAFCEMLRKERLKRKITQEELASRLGRPQSFVAKIEKGERRLDLIEFLIVARAVGISPSTFLRKLEIRIAK